MVWIQPAKQFCYCGCRSWWVARQILSYWEYGNLVWTEQGMANAGKHTPE